MRYDFSCPRCKIITEIIMSMSEAGEKLVTCDKCDSVMLRDFRRINVGRGHKQYRRQIVSDSLAMNPDQIAEHRQLFPDIQVTGEGQPVFDNFADHEKYLEKCNVEKVPGKRKKRGKRIA